MEHFQKGMNRKWERHYRMTKMTWAIIAMISASALILSMVFIWPQYLSKMVFNSRLSNRMIINIEDYFTCSEGLQQFIIDEPSTDDVLFSIYVFNVSNAKDVFEIGYKPKITETGPYAYKKRTYKYDVEFDPVNDFTLSFKEFNYIEEVHDPMICQDMYYRQDRDFLEIAFDPCVVSDCKCKNHNSTITVINPLLLKLLYEDSSSSLIAQYSKDIFSNIKKYYEVDFVSAVKAHLVAIAFQEITLFRLQMNALPLINQGYTFLKQTYTNSSDLEQLILYKPAAPWAEKLCGITGVTYCPLSMLFDMGQTKDYITALYKANYNDDPKDYIIPSMIPWLDPNNSRSYLNENAFAKWLAIAYYWTFLEFNPPSGYSIITNEEILAYHWDFVDYIATQDFGTNYSYFQGRGAELLVLTIARWLGKTFVKPLSAVNLQALVLDEYWNSKDLKICSPQGDLCQWQWGFMEHPKPFTTAAAASMVSIQTKVNTNPANFFYDLNTFRWYNSYKFCNRAADKKPDMYYTDELFNTFEGKTCELPDMTYTHDDGVVGQPAGVWGVDNGINAVNKTYLNTRYKMQDNDVQLYYFYYSCNISFLQHEVYPKATPFHDKFVIAYLNKFKSDDFTHQFTVGKWEELGWAQWGTGVVTNALVGVKSVNQLRRDGCWHYGYESYYNILPEFSSWAIKMGYPNTFIFDPYESRALLHALADRSPDGAKFRKDIVYAGTTLIGDGSYIVNQVGYSGDVAYISEAIKGDFTCSGKFQDTCALLNERFTSSLNLCTEIEYLFSDCVYRGFQGNAYITNCANFQTSISSPTMGIQCDLATVYGKAHPYTKARGNVVFSMIYGMVLDLELKQGLWCPFYDNCEFEKGGMFTTTTVRQVLFEGFTESSSLYYLNQKHEHQNISIRCIDDPYDSCGDVRYYCSSRGVTLHLPNGDKKNFSYGNTKNDEFFAPKLHIRASTGELIWPYAMNETLNKISRNIMASEETILLHNPHWTAFPDWYGKDYDFQKYYQCAGRIYSGPEGQLASCLDTMNTGIVNLNETLNFVALHGNRTINHYKEFAMVVNGTDRSRHQYEAMRWDGINEFKYVFNSSTAGVDTRKLDYPMRFDKRHGLHLELSQRLFDFTWQKEQLLEFPIRKTWITRKESSFPFSGSKKAFTRRFTESKESWENLQQLGVPHDSYGMPYKIPIGMASVERLAGAPVFTSTPHQYGNELWGGFEHTHVQGYSPNMISQRTYTDYDPVSGLGLRNALRTQINFRVEKSPLFPQVFSSQGRCVAPSKSFSGYTGYGCFAYVPLMWYEDAESMNVERFYRLEDHFLSRGDRAYTVLLVGAILGALIFALGFIYFIEQQYIMRRFHSRVYVD